MSIFVLQTFFYRNSFLKQLGNLDFFFGNKCLQQMKLRTHEHEACNHKYLKCINILNDRILNAIK